MAARPVLLLGNSELYKVSEPVFEGELKTIDSLVADLHDTLLAFRARYGAGRAIAAPQIGVLKRVVYMHVDERSTVFINPMLELEGEKAIEVWDDCMCFPDLLVKVMRYNACRVRYRNLEWQEAVVDLEGDLSELLQHEYDHLDGVLAVSRAIDAKSFALRSERDLIKANQ